MDTPLPLADAMAELVSAEDFLEFFGIPYDPEVLRVSRLHILQRFHDYLARSAEDPSADDAVRREACRHWLARAYEDFVESDALAEKVFRVFRTAARPGGGATAFVPLDQVLRP